MPHFADSRWNNPCGTVKKIYAVYTEPINASATVVPNATTGALDLVDGTYTVPRNGFVRVSWSLYQNVADSAVGSTFRWQIAATDVLGNSRIIAPVTGFAALDSISYTETAPQVLSTLLYCKAGTTIKLQWNFGVAANGDGRISYYAAFEMDR